MSSAKPRGAEFVGEHVAAVAGVGSDLEKWRHFADGGAVLVYNSGAAAVLLGVLRDDALGLTEGSEVVELDLGAFDGEGLSFSGHSSMASFRARRSGSRRSGECSASSSMATTPVATAMARMLLARAARTSLG